MSKKKDKTSWTKHWCASCEGIFKAPSEDKPPICRLCGGMTEKE